MVFPLRELNSATVDMEVDVERRARRLRAEVLFYAVVSLVFPPLSGDCLSLIVINVEANDCRGWLTLNSINRKSKECFRASSRRGRPSLALFI